MAFSEEGMVMPVAPMSGNNGFGFGGDGSWWILLLFILLGGWGNGFGGGNNGVTPWQLANNTDALVTNGFDQAATAGMLSGIQSSITNGFSTAEVAACNRAMDAMQTAYTNQIAGMNQRFADSQALTNQLNSISSALQNCCCENRAATADLKYTVATEACADRSAISNALRDVLSANTASTQRILDQMCQDKIDEKNDTIAQLRQELLYARGQASQNAQTATILTDNLAQTNALEQYLAPVPRPAYVVQNPNCCAQNTCGCGSY